MSINGEYMRIAICEDNREHAEILKEMVNHWAAHVNIEVDIGYYSSAEQFLFYMQEDAHYDLAFLDIQLEKMNGLQLAKMIRKEDRTMFLIFTTGEKGYALSGYEVSAFRYLIKPLKEKDIMDTLTKANRLLETNKKDAIIVNCGNVARRIYKNEIYYIEVDDHYIILHLKEEDIRFKAKLRDFESQFQEPRFCKCHRSYIVNLHYVSKISREGLVLDGETNLPISRGCWDAINRCYMAYYTMH